MQFQKGPKSIFELGKKFKTAKNAISREKKFLLFISGLILQVFWLKPKASLKGPIPIYRRPCCQKEEMNEESAIERVGWKHLLSYIKCDNECGRMRMNLLLRRDP